MSGCSLRVWSGCQRPRLAGSELFCLSHLVEGSYAGRGEGEAFALVFPLAYDVGGDAEQVGEHVDAEVEFVADAEGVCAGERSVDLCAGVGVTHLVS